MGLKHLALAAALIMLASGVTACGKRGPLDPPPGSAAAEEAKAKKAKKAKNKDGKVIEERENAAEKRHEPFILDVLL